MRRYLAVAAAVALLAGCASDYQGPTCKPHSKKCEQAHGVWVPSYYYRALQHAQRTSNVPDPNGDQPSGKQIRASGGSDSDAHAFGGEAHAGGEGGSHAVDPVVGVK